MHAEARAYVAGVVDELGPFGRVVEFGSRNVNGKVRDLFDCTDYIGVDIADGPGVDVVCDASKWRGYGGYDVVVCCEVLEHTAEIGALCESAKLALVRGGRFIVTCATDPREPHSAVDGGPDLGAEWYANVTVRTLERCLETAGFGSWVTEVDTNRGDLYATATV